MRAAVSAGPNHSAHSKLRSAYLVLKMIVSGALVAGILAGAYVFEANIVSRTTLFERFCLTIVACGAFNFYWLMARQAFDEWRSNRMLREFYTMRMIPANAKPLSLVDESSCSGPDGFDYDELAAKARRSRGGS